jgi:hypothetical protein
LKEVDFHTQLRDAVIKKAASYGKIPYPFVVAVNALEPVSDFDIGAALYGTEKVTIPFTKEGAPDPDHSKISRELDGVWTSFKGPSRQRVSAVLVTSSLRPWSLSEASFAAFHNPWATFPLTFAVNKIQQHILLKDQLVKIEGQPLPELLGFPWPPDVTTS